ncbi:MAG: hemerythrin domain-containing protein [Gammaproteobacteria bacterium]|nr:hemerythrin domain-containing protein [Gammaproteobacteria bacterium]
MKDSICSVFGAHHRHCDDLLNATENLVHRGNWPGAETSLRAFVGAMLHHLDAEESILFPAVEARTGQVWGPTRIMRMEHQQMCALFENMRQDIEARDRQHYLGLSETLLTLLQQHNLKEEQVLYPLADRALTGEISGLLQRVRANIAPEP